MNRSSSLARPIGPQLSAAAAPRRDVKDEQPPHVEFLGLRFGLLSQSQAVSRLIEETGAPYRYVVTPNAYDVVMAHEQRAAMLPLYRGAWLSLCDSRILRALARLDGHALPLVTGSDLVAALLSALNAARSAKQVVVVGPDRAVAAALRAAYPHAAIDIMPAPAGLARDAEARLAVARACSARSWDLLLLCVGAPAQQLIARQIGELGRTSGVALCVGASIDYLTGAQARAPRWIQNLSLEWAYRLAREPARLWRRYLVESPKVLRIFAATRGTRALPKRVSHD
jgi:N-acetylglucosaminyldiphosphoundecaprenol N-acetyl-beta-D-mannosaminyltransferase